MHGNIKSSFLSISIVLVVVSTSWALSDSVANSDRVTTASSKSNVGFVQTRIRGLSCQPITLTTQNGQVGDGFGLFVAMDSDVVVVSAIRDNDVVEDGGAVYIFRKIGNVWVEEQKLLASDGQSGDLFGVSLAIQNDILLVGSYGQQVHVFVYDGTFWQEQAILTPWDADSGSGGGFGLSVGIDNGVAIVGSPSDMNQGCYWNPCGAC